MGNMACLANRSVIRKSGCWTSTCLALYIFNTILSENQYEPKFINAANPNATNRPFTPPISSPMASNNPLIKPSSKTVFIEFAIFSPLSWSSFVSPQADNSMLDSFCVNLITSPLSTQCDNFSFHFDPDRLGTEISSLDIRMQVHYLQ